MVANRTFSRSLRCKLTNKERLSKGEELAGENDKIAQHEAEKSQAGQYHGSQIKAAWARIHILAKEIGTGETYRDVECETRLDYDNHRAVTVRLDTQEEIEVRPLNEAERQQPLPLEDGTPTGDAPPPGSLPLEVAPENHVPEF